MKRTKNETIIIEEYPRLFDRFDQENSKLIAIKQRIEKQLSELQRISDLTRKSSNEMLQTKEKLYLLDLAEETLVKKKENRIATLDLSEARKRGVDVLERMKKKPQEHKEVLETLKTVNKNWESLFRYAVPTIAQTSILIIGYKIYKLYKRKRINQHILKKTEVFYLSLALVSIIGLEYYILKTIN